jgi:uncharacterized protein DUF2190
MAYEAPGAYQVTKTAGGDLRTLQYHAWKLDANGNVVPITAITDRPFGIGQDNPNTGGDGGVMLTGISYMKAGAAFTLPAIIGVDSTGRCVKIVPGTDTTQFAIGQALEAPGAANEIIAVVQNCINCSRAS